MPNEERNGEGLVSAFDEAIRSSIRATQTTSIWESFASDQNTSSTTGEDTPMADEPANDFEVETTDPTVYTDEYLISLFAPGGLDRYTPTQRTAVFSILRSSGRFRYNIPGRSDSILARIPNFDRNNVAPETTVEDYNPTNEYLLDLLPPGDVNVLSDTIVSIIIARIRTVGEATYSVTPEGESMSITRHIIDPNYVSSPPSPGIPATRRRGTNNPFGGTPLGAVSGDSIYKKTYSKNEKRVFMNFDFKEGQEVICTDLSGYDGKYISQGMRLVVAKVGNNVLGFESIKSEEGKIIKFMKYRFTPVEHLNTICNLREKGKYSYRGSKAKITGEINMKTFVVPIGTGSSFQKAREVYVWELKVFDPGFIKKDVLQVKPFESIAKYREGSYYYIGSSEWNSSIIENLYLDEVKKLVVKSVDKTFITLKGFKYKFPKEIFTISKMAKEPLELQTGVNVLIKEKGVEEGVYTVIDLKKTSSLTLVGITINGSLTYVNGKNCKILEENAQEKKKV